MKVMVFRVSMLLTLGGACAALAGCSPLVILNAMAPRTHECHDCLQALLYPCRYLQSWRKLKSETAEYLDSTEIGLVIVGK